MEGSFSRAKSARSRRADSVSSLVREREFFIDSLLVRIHFIIMMFRWFGLAPWGFEFPFPGSPVCTLLQGLLEMKNTHRP